MNDIASSTALPLGTCRCVTTDGCRSRRRRNSSVPLSCPFGVIHCAAALPAPLWILCRVTGSLEANDDYATVCYSQSIIVTGGLSLDDWIDSNLVAEVYIGSQESEFSSQLRIGLVPSETAQQKPPFFAPLQQNPVPALSVSFTYVASPLGPGRSLNSNLLEQPLLQSCLKRQLVGCPFVYYADRCISTQIHVTLQNRTWTMTVVSCVCARQQQQGLTVALILPSTRITLLSPGDDDRQRRESAVDTVTVSCEADKHEKKQREILSTPARILVDTIQCIKHVQKGDIPRAFLLTGPPGVGKTHAVRLAVQHCGSHLTVLQGSEILAEGHPTEAALSLKRHFQKAVQQTYQSCTDSKMSVSVVFLDECDALLSSSSVTQSISVMEAMLGHLLDRMNSDLAWKRLLVVAATNRIDIFPSSLRRPGRFDREIPLAPPDATTRLQILETLLRQEANGKHESDVSITPDHLREIADACVGYVPADLAALVRRSELLRITQSSKWQEGKHSASRQIDLLRQAMSDVGASALRDVALQAPPITTWDSVAGDPGGAKTALRQAIEWPRTKSRAYEALGLTPPRGILLHGPPGCAKTTLARAAAGTSAVAFLSLSPADVYASSYVGEAEAVVRRAFTLARSAAPCVLFFDEIDAIIGSDLADESHGMGRGPASSAEARVLSTFLNEMDGIDGFCGDGVLVLGATNRPSIIDAALCRPGRLDQIIFVPEPDFESRRSILSMQCSHWKAAGCVVDIDRFATETSNMTGAEIVGACREACMRAFRDAVCSGSDEIVMKEEYLIEALREVQPLLANPVVMEEYRSFEDRRKRLAA